MRPRIFPLLTVLILAALVVPPAIADDTTARPGPSSGAFPASGEDIRDIRPPIPIPAPTRWGPWLVGGGGALAGALLGVLLLRRRQARTLGLTDRTLQRLRTAEAHIESEDAYAFAIHLSEILRQYLEGRFGLPATQQTTPEFLRDLATRDLPEVANSHDLLYGFLDACDAAKYARYALGRARMEAMVDDAARFVEATRPVPRSARRARPAGAVPATEPTHASERGAA